MIRNGELYIVCFQFHGALLIMYEVDANGQE